MRALADALLSLGKTILEGLGEALNTPITSFGVFGGWLKKLGFPEISFLDIIAVVIAIPITLLSKMITQKNPEKLHNLDMSDSIENGELSVAAKEAASEIKEYMGITWALYKAIEGLIGIATAELPEPKPISFISVAFDVIMLSVAMPMDDTVPGVPFRWAVWGLAAAEVGIKAVSATSLGPTTLFGWKGKAAFSLFFGIATFILGHAIHAEELADQDASERGKITVRILDHNYKTAMVLATSFGILAVDPASKVVAASVMGVARGLKGVTATTLAVMAKAEK